MTLRLRLVLALVALTALGLAVFGMATYALFNRTQHDRLDDQIESSLPVVTTELRREAGFGPGPGSGRGPGRASGRRRPAPPRGLPFGTYAELRLDGDVVADSAPPVTDEEPSLPDLPDDIRTGHFFSTGSRVGSGTWRVYAAEGADTDEVVVVAVPLTEVTNAVRRLVLIESTAALALLAILAAGSWLVLRRGLRPLERMASTASSISAGDLSQRVEPTDDRTEVGQLGLALNTMLGEIEEAFRERDATEQKLRQFLADASHELRTPLTSIQGFAELFRLGAEHDHVDVGVILRRIEEESTRMRTLVDDLLLLARLDQTRPAARVPVDLTVLAADACSDAVAAAPGRAVTLHAPEPVLLDGDRDHLRQAIANMVGNALRHTPEGTPLEVTVVQEDGTATLQVRDHGPGLDDEAMVHGFDRFWQADRARVGEGHGLGLAIVAGIAAEHDGVASAANAEGGGAVFTLRLPVS